MKTKIKTIHEEGLSDNSKSFGVLVNYSLDHTWFESFIYLFNNMNYVFFNTIDDLNAYLFFREKDMKRGYMEENVFDSLYDAEFIEGEFKKHIEWL